MLRLFLEKCKTVNEVIELEQCTSGIIQYILKSTEQRDSNEQCWPSAIPWISSIISGDWNGKLRYQTITKAVSNEQINSFDDAVALLSGKHGGFI